MAELPDRASSRIAVLAVSVGQARGYLARWPRGPGILLSRAADLVADMIVSGVYHHSPLREALLGGVSSELLQHMPVPVLMLH